MSIKKLICTLVILSFVLSFVAPVFAAPPQANGQKVYSYLESDDALHAKPGKPGVATQSVSLRSIASGDTVFEKVLIVAQATGTPASVVYQIDGFEATSMTKIGATDRYEALWTINPALTGQHVLTVTATASNGAVVSDSATVNVATSVQWSVFFEIDYLAGHEPTQAVLDYMTAYWRGHGIEVAFKVDDVVVDPTSGDGYISDSDFWNIEATYNDETYYNDKASDLNGRDYYLPEKWVLYGNQYSVANVGGYTYCPIVSRDNLGGNYIFLADSRIDQWQLSGAGAIGVETVVLCHEAGHSIGILVARGNSEKYDPDAYSVMSTIRSENSFNIAGYWYYSKEYWVTADLSAYAA